MLLRLAPDILDRPDLLGTHGDVTVLGEVAEEAGVEVDQVLRVLEALECRIYPEPYEYRGVSADVVGDQLRALRRRGGMVTVPYYAVQPPSPRIRPAVAALVRAGLMPPPDDATVEEFVGQGAAYVGCRQITVG